MHISCHKWSRDSRGYRTLLTNNATSLTTICRQIVPPDLKWSNGKERKPPKKIYRKT